MSSITDSLIAFACMFGGALFGLRISSLLPNHHLSQEAKDIVKLGAGLIDTLAALVLGLLSSAKGTLDAMDTELKQEGAKIIAASRMVGTSSMTWCHWARSSPLAFTALGQWMTMALRVPP